MQLPNDIVLHLLFSPVDEAQGECADSVGWVSCLCAVAFQDTSA